MTFENIIGELAFIYAGAAVLATVFLFLRQPIIVAYIVLGMIAGPYGLRFIENAEHIEHIAHLGIILLLFLVGLNLHPQKLYMLFKRTALVTVGTCALFAGILGGVAYAFGYTPMESVIIGCALMFSSTVIGLKLIPTTDLHNQHIGEVMISVLLFQDILAILLMLFLKGGGDISPHIFFPLLLVKGTVLCGVAFVVVKYVIVRLFLIYDVIQEYVFVVALGWCLLMAAMAHVLGLSYEIGAFIAGVTLAISPVSLVISERLKSLREFFLILFFFAIGSQFDFLILKDVVWVSVVLGSILLVLKPLVFQPAFRMAGEDKAMAAELACRLGQASEFSLIAAYVAFMNHRISDTASYVIQLTVIITFVVSTYVVSARYKTPIAVNATQRKD